MVIADMQAFTDRLRLQFPDGLVIPLPDEDLPHLLDIGEAVEEGLEYDLDPVSFAGQIGSVNRHWVPSGTLRAELRIPVDMYDRVFPVEDAYPLDVDGADWMDWEDRAATRLLHDHPDTLVGAEVEVTIREDILPHLFIEGRPFPSVMQTVDRTHCFRESDLRQVLNLLNVHEHGLPADGRLPACFESLLGHVADRYRQPLLAERDRAAFAHDLHLEAERLLKVCGALPCDRHNLTVTFAPSEGDRWAHYMAHQVNARFAPDKAFAVCRGDVVEVSVHSQQPADQVAVKDVFQLGVHSDVTSLTEQPYRNIGAEQRLYLLCFNGQLLKGYLGVEGLSCAYEYGFLPAEGGQKAKLTVPGRGAYFVSDDRLERFYRSFVGENMPVSYMAGGTEVNRFHLLQGMDIAMPDKRSGVSGEVWLSGRIGGEPVEPRQLSAQDALLLQHFEQRSPSQADHNLVKAMLCSAYYGVELHRAWQKEQQAARGRADKADAHQRLVDRITDATLYGRVDNVHVRCKVDGVQQMGRPITVADAQKYAVWRQDASMLGRDTLNYKNWLHEDYIKEIAVHAFADVLSREPSQERSNGVGR